MSTVMKDLSRAAALIGHYIICAGFILGGATGLALMLKAATMIHAVLLECGITSGAELLDNLRPSIANCSMSSLIVIVIMMALALWVLVMAIRLMMTGFKGLVSSPYWANGLLPSDADKSPTASGCGNTDGQAAILARVPATGRKDI